ncbi:MAG: hypothetical protein ACOC0U_03985 [Desulfovibrionales bacterium]
MKKLLVLAVAALFLSACASTINRDQTADADPDLHAAQEPEDTHFYYDFEDILVPQEMDLDPKESLLFEAPRAKAGALVFSGRVDPVSLFNFFMVNMSKDNWTLRSYFKYSRYVLVFEKPHKDCIITIVEGRLKTTTQIWVAPRMNHPEPVSVDRDLPSGPESEQVLED